MHYIKDINSRYEVSLNKISKIINKKIVVSLNWPYIMVFVCLWSYGYQGAIGLESPLFQLGFSTYLIGITAYFLFLGSSKKELITSKFTFLIKDILVLGIMFAFWTTIAFDKFSQSIVSDQLYFGLEAKKHEFFAIQILNKFVNIENVVFKDAIYLLDILIIMSVAFFIFLRRFIKFNFPSVSILICLVLLILRYVTISQGGGVNAHPPFQLFPIWLSTSIFGLSDLTLRFAQYIGLIGCSFMIYLTSIKRLGNINSFFVATALCAIPLLIHVATQVSASIWTSILWILLLIQIPSINERNSTYWFGLTSVISIFVLLRVTSFIAYPIILIYLMKYNWPIFLKDKKAFVHLTSPFLICLPLLAISIIIGTPGSTGAVATFIDDDYLIFNHFAYVLSSGALMEIVLSTMNASWLLLLFGIFIKLKNEKNYLFHRLLIILFLILAIEMFFSITPVLWSADRYQAEWLVPFLILGGYLIFSKIQEISKQKILIPLLSSLMIFFGVVGFQGYQNNIPNITEEKNFKMLTEKVYDYKSALIAAKEAGLEKNTLLVGTTYGIFPQILYGYSIKEVEKSYELYKKHLHFCCSTLPDPELINNDPEVKLVLISNAEFLGGIPDAGNGDSLRSSLLLMGWLDWKQFSSSGNNVIFGIIRPD